MCDEGELEAARRPSPWFKSSGTAQGRFLNASAARAAYVGERQRPTLPMKPANKTLVSMTSAAIVLVATVALAHAQLPSAAEPRVRPGVRTPVLDAMPEMPTDEAGVPITNLTVFMIPHSHDDTGWLRTVDQYYEESVRYIYNAVVASLRANRKRKFIFVETAYFMRWWRDQGDETRNATKQLFKNGQLEFVNGGWCMADDASPSADGQIDQVTLGHRYVEDIFGVRVKYGWHIDPFGLSASYALWWKEMNYSAWLINRVDTRLKDLWHNDTHLQFHWNPAGAGDNDGIFAHVLDTHYGAPELTYKGFHYHWDWEGDQSGSQKPVTKTRPLEGDGNRGSIFYNATAPDSAEAFVALARLRASFYKLGSPHQRLPAGQGAILVPFGDDMKFQNADKQYMNMDLLMDAVNANPSYGVNVQYGTIGDYMTLINQDGANWPSYTGDFMPLATDNNVYTSQVSGSATDVNAQSGYWSGHYTTRPLMKGLVARADGAKHTAEIAASLACATGAPLSNQSAPNLQSLCGSTPDADMMLSREVTSVLQHHDNIPGTSVHDAAINLDVRLNASILSSDAVMRKALGLPSAADGMVVPNDLDGTRRVVQPGQAILLFNPTAVSRHDFVEFELPKDYNASVRVVDTRSQVLVPSVVIPALPPTMSGDIEAIKDGSRHAARLVVNVTVPALSYRSLSTAPESEATASPAWSCGTVAAGSFGQDVVLQSGTGLTVTFSKDTGRIASVTLADPGSTKIEMLQEFAEYHATQQSDAYQFHPNRSQYPFGEPLQGSDFPSANGTQLRLCFIKTELLQRVVQIYLSGTPPAPLPPAVPLPPEDGIDCSTEERCKKTCPFMTTCGDGVFYCCGPHGHLKQCSASHVCPTDSGLKDCACGNPPDDLLPKGTQLLSETVTLFAGTTLAGFETVTEFSMKRKERELVTRYATDINNTIQSHFYGSTAAVDWLPVFETDSNGMLMMRRVVNKTHWGKNESYFHVSSPVAGNYYPLASPGAIRIQSQTDSGGPALAVVTDRAHGGSGLQSGWLEIMLSRRVNEGGLIGVDDQDFVAQRNWIFPAASAAEAAAAQRLQQVRASAPLASLVLTQSEISSLSFLAQIDRSNHARGNRRHETPAAGAESSQLLPLNLHLQSLDRVSLEYTPSSRAGRTLLRIRHVFQAGEHPVYSAAASADLNALFEAQGLSLSRVVEVSLDGTGGAAALPLSKEQLRSVMLKPLQTRTFEVSLNVSR